MSSMKGTFFAHKSQKFMQLLCDLNEIYIQKYIVLYAIIFSSPSYLDVRHVKFRYLHFPKHEIFSEFDVHMRIFL